MNLSRAEMNQHSIQIDSSADFGVYYDYPDDEYIAISSLIEKLKLLERDLEKLKKQYQIDSN